ncbi:hypothetical protein ACHQM5_007924 [Ranunculus cassubicifolius]
MEYILILINFFVIRRRCQKDEATTAQAQALMDKWGIASRVLGQRIEECRWLLPPTGILKINSDASLHGEVASIGSIFRDECEVKLVAWRLIGKCSIYFAECEAVITSAEIAISRSWKRIWIETDSSAAVHSLHQGKAPWQLQARWLKCLEHLEYVLISHSWREANFAADQIAKHAQMEQDNILKFFVGKPSWLRKIENPDLVYYRFR